ncbi:hypothetical protein AYO22_06429 [Fonsecaea multimorphosa]|nr:hypothetical protein AYO22_06429 [Fonsecaea multimorphosa]
MELIFAARSNDFDFERIKPLLISTLGSDPDSTVFWDQVYNAVTPPDQACGPIPPSPPNASWLLNRTNFSNSPNNRQILNGILKRVLGAIYAGILQFDEAFFGALADLVLLSGRIFTTRADYNNLPNRGIRDTLLHCQVDSTEGFYRFLREGNYEKRVIYVDILDISIIPEDSRTSGYELVRNLSQLSGWFEEWDTLTVLKIGKEIYCVQDHFSPHEIPPKKVVRDYPFFDILDLRLVARLTPTVTYVDNGSELCYLKMAPFRSDVDAVSQELEAYHVLARRNPRLRREFLGYAFEGPRERVVGYLVKATHAPTAQHFQSGGV